MSANCSSATSMFVLKNISSTKLGTLTTTCGSHGVKACVYSLAILEFANSGIVTVKRTPITIFTLTDQGKSTSQHYGHLIMK